MKVSFPLFLCMVMYDTMFVLNEKKNLVQAKRKIQQVH